MWIFQVYVTVTLQGVVYCSFLDDPGVDPKHTKQTIHGLCFFNQSRSTGTIAGHLVYPGNKYFYSSLNKNLKI